MKEENKSAEELTSKELQEAIEALDPLKNVQDLAALAAEMLAEEGMSTVWDDVLPMLDNDEISEQLRLAAHIIFRASLILEVLNRTKLSGENSEMSNLVYNTMLMMDAVEVANIKGYFPNIKKTHFNRVKGETSSLKSAIKREKVIDTIRELVQKNPDKRITWLRKKASSILSKQGEKGYSYRQILRDTKGIKIKGQIKL